MKISTEWNDGLPVVSCNWVIQKIEEDLEVDDDLLAYTDNPAMNKVRTRPPEQFPFSEKQVRWMQKCLDTCTQTHTICKEARAKAERLEKPNLLIDIGSNGDSDARLVKSLNSQGIAKYAILSYCWGQGSSKAYETTSDNLSARLESLNLHELPETIKDAIEVTRALGMRFLWVDVL
ncbi:hypothetical protein CGCVW01_v005962 [Colletotrichum viniferum]|nr:hypothetical protein CGCVW01_v005962 [Colletotrichum viniferum]